MPNEEKVRKSSIQSIDRATAILKALASGPRRLGVSELADRLGLETWRANVREKLKTLDDISRFAVEQSSISRGQLLEIAVILILVLELVLVFMGVMK